MGLIDIIKHLSTVLSSDIRKSQQHQNIKSWECRESNPGLLDEKQACYLCSSPPKHNTLLAEDGWLIIITMVIKATSQAPLGEQITYKFWGQIETISYKSSSWRSSCSHFFDCSNSTCCSMATIRFCRSDNSGTNGGTRSMQTALEQKKTIWATLSWLAESHGAIDRSWSQQHPNVIFSLSQKVLSKM